MINLKLIREVTRDKMAAFEMIHIPLKEDGMASRKKNTKYKQLIPFQNENLLIIGCFYC